MPTSKGKMLTQPLRLARFGVTRTSPVAGTDQIGGLSEVASVWDSLHDLSVHEDKDFTQTLYPSTCKERVASIAEESCWRDWVKLKDELKEVTRPRASLSANTITIAKLVGSLAFLTSLG